MRNTPGLDQVSNDFCIHLDRVYTDALRDHCEMVEQISVGSVEHQATGHGNVTLQHRAEGEHCPAGSCSIIWPTTLV